MEKNKKRYSLKYQKKRMENDGKYQKPYLVTLQKGTFLGKKMQSDWRVKGCHV